MTSVLPVAGRFAGAVAAPAVPSIAPGRQRGWSRHRASNILPRRGWIDDRHADPMLLTSLNYALSLGFMRSRSARGPSGVVAAVPQPATSHPAARRERDRMPAGDRLHACDPRTAASGRVDRGPRSAGTEFGLRSCGPAATDRCPPRRDAPSRGPAAHRPGDVLRRRSRSARGAAWSYVHFSACRGSSIPRRRSARRRCRAARATTPTRVGPGDDPTFGTARIPAGRRPAARRGRRSRGAPAGTEGVDGGGGATDHARSRALPPP